MASTVDDTCEVFNAKVADPGALGDVEHLRPWLERGSGHLMAAGELMWITDQTPHEAYPVHETVYRQYFRLVTSEVSEWYSQHNTANPLGVKPDGRVTSVLTNSKFDGSEPTRAE